jgi:hypothetical protein
MPAVDIWSKSLFPSLVDYIVISVYLIIMFLMANYIKNRHIDQNPIYKYYVWGLFAKVAGAVAMGLIYTLYYKDGGDTTAYYRSSEALVNLFLQNPMGYFKILFGEVSKETILSSFSNQTGYPMYWTKYTSFSVVRVTSFFTIIGLKNYFTSTILFAWFFYKGYWKLFLLVTRLYPKYHQAFAFSILFFPSVLFWGSGISKDAIALSMTGWFVYSLYYLVVEKEKILKNALVLIFTTMVLLSVKAYIFVALVPGGVIYLAWSYLKKIRNPVFRLISAPLTIVAFLALGLGILNLFGPMLGEYGSIDGIIHKAIVTYEDHTRAQQYGENYYSLGTFDGTRWNFFSKAPKAIIAGLFRPYLWEARNPVMLLAGLENLGFLILVLIILWRTGPIKTIRLTLEEPLIIFSLSFAIAFAFAVGIATANFGALVRLKIPLIPFLAVGLFTLYYRSMEIRAERENKDSKTLIVST